MAKKAKPRERLYRWRVSMITKTLARFTDYAEAPDVATAEELVAKEHKIPDTLRNRLIAIRDET